MLKGVLDHDNVITACDFNLLLLFYMGDGLSSHSFNLMSRNVSLEAFHQKEPSDACFKSTRKKCKLKKIHKIKKNNKKSIPSSDCCDSVAVHTC